MDRREAVKRISAMLGVAVSGTTMAGILGGCEASPGHLRVLSAKQHELLAVMTEHILPSTDTPGAFDANVADYIDAMLADFYSDERKAGFLKALDEMDTVAEARYELSYLKCPPESQFTLLDEMDQAAFPDLATMSEAEQEAFQQQRAENGRPFIVTLKELTLAGFYTSEVGATQELRVNPSGDWKGDIPYSDVGRAWA